MQKSTLSLYIQKMAEGDRSFATRLCAQLAERLLYVPTKAQAKTGQRVKVSIFRLYQEGQYIVPVFTSEKKLRDWSLHEHRELENISLLGADFCSALDSHASIWIDPGSEPNVKLPPDLVREISLSGVSEDYADGGGDSASPREHPAAATTPSSSSVVSSLASFPSMTSPPVAPPVSPPIQTTRKEDFPPFVPPTAQPSSPPPTRGVEQREPPPLETVRAHRSSLAAGILTGEPREVDETEQVSSKGDGKASPSEPAQTTEPKKKGIFGLFSKK